MYRIRNNFNIKECIEITFILKNVGIKLEITPIIENVGIELEITPII